MTNDQIPKAWLPAHNFTLEGESKYEKLLTDVCKIGETSTPKPSTSPTPSPTPSTESSPSSDGSNSFSNVNYGPGFPCRYDLADSGQQEIEDWRSVDHNFLPSIWLDQVPACTDLKYFTSARFDSWTTTKIPAQSTEFIDWMSRFHPQKSLAVCTAIFKSSTPESQRSQLRKNARALCDSVPKRWRYDIATRVEDWQVRSSSGIEPKVALDFQKDVGRPVEATNKAYVAVPSTSSDSQGPTDGEFSAWTKLLDNGNQLKFYVKYPQVGQKIQFMVQTGSGVYLEIGWIRVDEADLDESGNFKDLTNEVYFIRTVDLQPGKNRIRILVDGELVWGTRTYTGK